MSEPVILGVLVLSLLANVWVLAGQQRLRGVIRTGLRKAERDRCEMVRLPYNQVAKLMGWKPEFEGDVRTSAYPMRSAKEFAQKPGRHPALLSPARREKL